MNNYRSWLGNKLFKLAADLYVPGNSVRMKMGNAMFKLAASVSPDKPAKAKLKEATVKLKKTVEAKKAKKTKK